MTAITLQSAQSEPRNPADPSRSSQPPQGKWHHVRTAKATFWITNASSEVIDSYSAFFGANFLIWAHGSGDGPFDGYAFASDAAGRVGVIPAASLAPGWRPNAIVRRAD
jgi:hypothetical protein